MGFLVIDEKRLFRMLEYDTGKSAVGIMNWMGNSKTGEIIILLHVRGVDYIFSKQYEPGRIPFDISKHMRDENAILGVIESGSPKLMVGEDPLDVSPHMDETFLNMQKFSRDIGGRQ